MTKIRIFVSTDSTTLEKDVNDFLVGKKLIDIKYQSGKCNEDSHEDFWDSLVVIYE